MSSAKECAWRGGRAPAIAALLAYAAACMGTFVYDDHHSVRENTALHTLANVPSFFVDVDMFSSLDNRMYRPVLLCTFALNHAVAGVEPWAYKATNLLLHALTAWLLYHLARRLGAGAGAGVAATLFAVHPLGAEAVNMVSGRSELLVVCALVAGMHCHLSAMAGVRRAWIGTAACALAACGSKETGVVLAPLLLLLEGLRGARDGGSWRRAARRVLPVLAVVIGYLLVRRALLGVATLEAPRWGGGFDPRTGAGRDLATQLATMALALPRTLGQVVVPVGLSIDPEVSFTDRLTAGVGLGALLLGFLTWRGLRRPLARPACFVGTALAWATALPWVLIPLNVPLSEHRLYGPLAGLAVVLAGVWPKAARPRAAAWRWIAAAVVPVLGCLSFDRSLLYRDERALWEDAYALHPASYRARYSLGACAMREGRLEEARRWMEAALEMHPSYHSAQRNLVELHLQLGARGDPHAALRLAHRLVEVEPRSPFHHLLLSRALAAVGVRTGDSRRFDEAVAAALHCLEIAAPKGLVYRTAASARRLQGDLEGALALLDASVAAGLDHSTVLLDRHDVCFDLGRRAEAWRDLWRVLAAEPFNARALAALERHRESASPR